MVANSEKWHVPLINQPKRALFRLAKLEQGEQHKGFQQQNLESWQT